MSWDSLQKAKAEGGGAFIKLKDGEFVEGVFRGEPRCFYQTFKDTTEYDNWEEGRSFKFKINFIVKTDDGKLVARVYQGGAKVRDALLDAKSEYGLDCIFKIKRTGTGKDDTRYSILFKEKLEGAKLALYNEVTLRPLTPKQDQDETPPPSGNDVPF